MLLDSSHISGRDKREVTWQLVEARRHIYPTLLWATSHLRSPNLLKIHFKQPNDQTGPRGAPAGTMENTLDSCGHCIWRGSTQVKRLVTKMNTRREGPGRTRSSVLEVLLHIDALWKQLTNFTAFSSEWLRLKSEIYKRYSLKMKIQAKNIQYNMSKHFKVSNIFRFQKLLTPLP